jgi:hypothetical protein
MHVPTDPLALHFVSLVAEAKRDDIGARQHGVDFYIAAIEAARPTAVRSVEIEPVVLAVDGNVVGHQSQLSVANEAVDRHRVASL